MSVDAAGSSTQNLDGVTTTSSKSTGAERVGQQTLGQDEFFKLLTTQLASQDPLQPMEDTAFIAQMASFSQLEMTSAMTKSFDRLSDSQEFASAHSYIGKVVSLSTGEEGLVTSVERQNGETIVFLDGDNSNGRSVDTIFRVATGEGATLSSSRQVVDAADLEEIIAKTVTQTADTITKAFVGPVADGQARDGISTVDPNAIDAPNRGA